MMKTTYPWVAALATCILGACWTPVATDLSQDQARKVTLELQVAGIPAQMKGGAGLWSVRVPDTAVPAAHALLVHLVSEAHPDFAWYPEPEAFQLHEDERQRDRLLSLIEGLPGVVRADLVTGLPERPNATVVVHAGHAWDPATEGQIRTLVSSQWPFPVDVSVVVLPMPQGTAVPTAQVGPWTMLTGSAGSFRATLVGLGTLALLQAGLLAWQLRRKGPTSEGSASTTNQGAP
jgi:hypothetical protein